MNNDVDDIKTNVSITNNHSKLTASSNATNKMHSLKSLFTHTNWNPLVNGFYSCKQKGRFTRFLFVANSVDNNNIVNQSLLNQIFTQYGPLYDIFIPKDKSKANIAFINVNDAINAYFNLNNKIHPTLQRKLYLAFSQPRYPKQSIGVVPDFVKLSQNIPIPKGLILIENYITNDEESKLIKYIDTNNDTKWIENFSRRIKHYGYEFNYNTLSIDCNQKLLDLPKLFKDVLPNNTNKKQLLIDNINNKSDKSDNINDILSYCNSIDQCTINEYRCGQGIRPHIETTEYFDNYILSLSLLSPIIMDFRHKITNIKKSIIVKPRSLLIMGNDIRYNWSHGISHRKYDIINNKLTKRMRRVSITFRKIIKSKNINSNLFIAPNIEKTFVHNFYEDQAISWNHTRKGREWLSVKYFIELLINNNYPLLADIGCGNGKYLDYIQKNNNLNKYIYAIGMDLSKNLCKIVKNKGCEVFISDALLIPFNNELFDGIINIAVFHHISSNKRRIQLLSELFRITKINGNGLITAWALNQNDGVSGHKFRKQDSFVPFNSSTKNNKNDDTIKERFCHLYKNGELLNLIKCCANVIYIKSNLDYTLLQRKQEDKFKKQLKELLSTFASKENINLNDNDQTDKKKYKIIMTEFREKGNVVIAYKRLA